VLTSVQGNRRGLVGSTRRRRGFRTVALASKIAVVLTPVIDACCSRPRRRQIDLGHETRCVRKRRARRVQRAKEERKGWTETSSTFSSSSSVTRKKTSNGGGE